MDPINPHSVVKTELRFLILVGVLVCVFTSTLWGQQLEWVQQWATTGAQYLGSIDVDTAGNSYVAGSTSVGWKAFVRSYDREGNARWTQYIDEADAKDVAVGSTGVYVAGSTGGYSFVRKYDMDGDECWTKQFGTGYNDEARGISVDATGVYIAGVTRSGTETFSDAFVRKYDAEGNVRWVEQFGTDYFDQALSVSTNGTSVYVAGRTQGEFPGQHQVGQTDGFVRKYDTDGNVHWAKQFGSAPVQYAWSVSADATGVYLGGPAGSNSPDFVRRYDAEGNELWTIQLDSESGLGFDGISADSSGVYVVGGMHTDTSGTDAFVRKYSTEGAELWALQFGVWFNDAAHAVSVNATGVYVAGVTDSNGAPQDIFVACISPDDISPLILDVVATPNPVAVNTPVHLTATVDDSATGGSSILAAEYRIADGGFTPMNAEDGAFDETSEVVTADLTGFEEPGVYRVCVQGTDGAANISAQECILLAVYDPTSGFVTGGGWVHSLPGAYVADQTLEGKATFGFVSRYEQGATTPIGETEFQFRMANLEFHSDSYEWLVVAGHKAQYKGSGSVNGSGNYGFMLTATDEMLTPSTDVDLFRIKIWDKDNGDTIVYDNQLGDGDDDDPTTPIGGGNIAIHKDAKVAPPLEPVWSKLDVSGILTAMGEVPAESELLRNYPNPFNPETWFPYNLALDATVIFRIYNAQGQLIRTLNLGHQPAGYYTDQSKATYWDGRNESGQRVSSGVYWYQMDAGKFIATRRMVVVK